MHIGIVGAGAVGCFLAARLSDAGHRITLAGRPEQVAAIARDGLLVRDVRQETTSRYRPSAVAALTEQPDLVLLTVKTQDVAQACRDNLPAIHGVPVVAMQNGVQGDSLAGDVVGRETVVGAVVMCAASYVQPGEVSVEFPGWLIVGEPFGRVGRRTRAIAAVLDRAVPTYLAPRLAAVRRGKLIANLNNALCAATGLTLEDIMATPAGHALPARVMREGYQVIRAARLPLDHGLYGLAPRALVPRVLRRGSVTPALLALAQATMTALVATLPEPAAVALTVTAAHSRLSRAPLRVPLRFSTWQSIVRGRPTEIDYLNGEIVRLGARLGLPTPYNSHLTELVHRIEGSHVFCSVEELLPRGHVGV